MLPELKKIWHPKTYRRILTNKMTIVMYKLFHGDKYLHLAMMLYRLKVDFGFTNIEISNFSGVNPRTVQQYCRRVSKLLESQVMRVYSHANFQKEIEEWENRRGIGGSKQGFYSEDEIERWEKKRANKERKFGGKPAFSAGSKTEHLFDEMAKEQNGN